MKYHPRIFTVLQPDITAAPTLIVQDNTAESDEHLAFTTKTLDTLTSRLRGRG